jgi:hypothetical protein
MSLQSKPGKGKDYETAVAEAALRVGLMDGSD